MQRVKGATNVACGALNTLERLRDWWLIILRLHLGGCTFFGTFSVMYMVYSHARWVTANDSGLCCCVHVMSLRNSFCWFFPLWWVFSVDQGIHCTVTWCPLHCNVMCVVMKSTWKIQYLTAYITQLSILQSMHLLSLIFFLGTCILQFPVDYNHRFVTTWSRDSVWRQAQCCSLSENCIRFGWISGLKGPCWSEWLLFGCYDMILLEIKRQRCSQS